MAVERLEAAFEEYAEETEQEPAIVFIEPDLYDEIIRELRSNRDAEFDVDPKIWGTEMRRNDSVDGVRIV